MQATNVTGKREFDGVTLDLIVQLRDAYRSEPRSRRRVRVMNAAEPAPSSKRIMLTVAGAAVFVGMAGCAVALVVPGAVDHVVRQTSGFLP